MVGIAPKVWNALPGYLKSCPSVASFKESSKKSFITDYSKFACNTRGCQSCAFSKQSGSWYSIPDTRECSSCSFRKWAIRSYVIYSTIYDPTILWYSTICGSAICDLFCDMWSILRYVIYSTICDLFHDMWSRDPVISKPAVIFLFWIFSFFFLFLFFFSLSSSFFF